MSFPGATSLCTCFVFAGLLSLCLFQNESEAFHKSNVTQVSKSNTKLYDERVSIAAS